MLFCPTKLWELTLSKDNLLLWYDKADAVDKNEGKVAYVRYHTLLLKVAEMYNQPFDRVVAAFVSLSPNSDYLGNFRSLLSVLEAVVHGWSIETITTSTYNQARDRAYACLVGKRNILTDSKGPKILSFYNNILDPDCKEYVTINGHMVAIWKNKNLVMKRALINKTTYREISDTVKELAEELNLVPNALQATLWFTRKRVAKIIYSPQGDLFFGPDDFWKTNIDIANVKPYERKFCV